MLKNFFKTSWRSLAKNRISSIMNLLGLSLGIVSCLCLYLIISHEFSFDKFHPDRERIYRIIAERQEEGKEIRSPAMLCPMAPSIKEELTMLETITGFYNFSVNKVVVPSGDEVKELTGTNSQKYIIVADPEYFSIFHYEWLAGNPTVLNDPNGVVLSLKQAVKYFGDMPADEFLGNDIIYEFGNANPPLHLTVSGIVKDWTNPSDFMFTDFISIGSVSGNSALKRRIDMEDWNWWNYTAQIFIKLSPRDSPSDIETQLVEWQKKYLNEEQNNSTTLLLQPLRELHFDASLYDAYSQQADMPTLRIAMFIALFVLLIAVFNFINLTTAQTLQRAREIGIRKIFGATRKLIATQLLCETFIVVLAATVLALLSIHPVLALIHSFIPNGASFDLSVWTTWVFVIIIILATTLLAGFYPAIMISSASSLLENLKTRLKGTTKGRVRTALIVFQFSLALIFIIASIVIRRQVQFMQNDDLGFRKEGIIWVRGRDKDNVKIFAERLNQLPFIEHLSLHWASPALGGRTQIRVLNKNIGEAKETWASVESCDENFIPLYGMELVAGHGFFPNNNKELIINETYAKELGFARPEDAIGSLLTMEGGWAYLARVEEKYDEDKEFSAPIVGVVKDFHCWSKHQAITPYVFCNSTVRASSVSVKLIHTTKKELPNIIDEFNRIWKEINPETAMQYYIMEDLISDFYFKEKRTVLLINIAMLMAISISCMGLFGLALFTGKQRTKEIGIRKVLGASNANVLLMLLGDSLKLAGIALLIAFPVAGYFMIRWLEGFAYRVSLQVWMFALAVAIIVVLTLLTVGWQAVKAAKANPLEAIKTE